MPGPRRIRDNTTGEVFEMPWEGPGSPDPATIDLYRRQQEDDNSGVWGTAKRAFKWAWEPTTHEMSREMNYLSDMIPRLDKESIWLSDNISPEVGKMLSQHQGAWKGMLQGAGGVMDSMTSPAQIGLLAATLGSSAAAGAGYTGTANALSALEAAGGASMTGMGAYHAYNAQNPQEFLQSIPEMAGGVLGMYGGYHGMGRSAAPKTGMDFGSTFGKISDPRRMLGPGEEAGGTTVGPEGAMRTQPGDFSVQDPMTPPSVQAGYEPPISTLEVNARPIKRVEAIQPETVVGQPPQPTASVPDLDSPYNIHSPFLEEDIQLIREQGTQTPEQLGTPQAIQRYAEELRQGAVPPGQSLAESPSPLGVPTHDIHSPFLAEDIALIREQGTIQPEQLGTPEAIQQYAEQIRQGAAIDPPGTAVEPKAPPVAGDIQDLGSVQGYPPDIEAPPGPGQVPSIGGFQGFSTARPFEIWKQETIDMGYPIEEITLAKKVADAFGEDITRSDDLHDFDHYMTDKYGQAYEKITHDLVENGVEPPAFRQGQIAPTLDTPPPAPLPPPEPPPSALSQAMRPSALQEAMAADQAPPVEAPPVAAEAPPVTPTDVPLIDQIRAVFQKMHEMKMADKKAGSTPEYKALKDQMNRLAAQMAHEKVMPAGPAGGKIGAIGPDVDMGDTFKPATDAALAAEAASPQAQLAEMLKTDRPPEPRGKSEETQPVTRADKRQAVMDELASPEMVQDILRDEKALNEYAARAGMKPGGLKAALLKFLSDETGSFDLGATIEGAKAFKEKLSNLGKVLKIEKDVPEGAVGLFHDWMGKRAAGEVRGVLEARKIAGLNPADPKFRNYLMDASNRAGKMGEDIRFKQHFYPQLFKETGEQVFNAFGGRGGEKRFSLVSIPEAINEGRKLGLTPKHQTPAELVQWYENSLQKAQADRNFFKSMTDKGYIKSTKDAPYGWVDLDTSVFPTFGKEMKPGGWKVHPNVKAAIENYVKTPDDIWSRLASVTNASKNIALSSGVIPGTAINAHGVNIVARNVQARGVIKGTLEGIGMMLNTGAENVFAKGIEKVAPWKSARATLEGHLADAPEYVENGLNLSSEGFKFGTREKSKIPIAGKVVDWQRKMFEDPLFQNMVPALKLQHAKSIAAEMMQNGMERKAAITEGSKIANEVYGGLNIDRMFRDKTFQNGMRIIAIAPDWLESNARVGGGMAKSLYSGSERSTVYRRMVYSFAASYVMANLTNKYLSGHFMWNNSPGHTLQIDTGHAIKSGKAEKTVHLNPFGTAFDAIRLPMEMITGARRGDFSEAGRIARNRLSMPAGAFTNWLSNEDYRGRTISGKDPYGREIPWTTSATREINNVTNPFLPQYVAAPIEMATEGTSPWEALTNAIEAPVRFAGKPRPKYYGSGRSRSGR